MTDSDYQKKLREFEGYKEQMYLDSAGHVTIGEGIMLPSASAAKSASLGFTNDKKAKATPEEIETDYNAVKTKKKKVGQLTASSASLKKLLEKRLKDAEADRKAFYSDFAKLHSGAQYALLDMAFNLGRSKLMKYKNLKAALIAKDWKKAASESKRNGIQASRNKAISDWILSEK